MITFSYQARDTTGRIVSGVQEALNEENAVTALMSRGLMVLSLQRKAIASRSRKKTWTVKETDLVLCTRQLVSMVKAGETGGLLAEILDRLAGFLEASARLRKKVKSAMTYPVIVIIIAFAITTFLIVRVVPVFGEIFADFGAKLPAPTQFLIDLSNFVRGEWYVLFGGLAGVTFGVRTFLR